MIILRALLLILSLQWGLTSAAWAVGPLSPAISIIVAPGASHPTLSREGLALIFSRKKRFWENDQRIQPVNLVASHPLRRSFSQQIFGRSPEELEDYWRAQYFHGDLPPYALASEEAVIRFVATTPGAIGYVSHCAVDQRVTVVMQLDGSMACPHQTP
jgi:ABC-type phosphate transport system substrate-binding protein